MPPFERNGGAARRPVFEVTVPGAAVQFYTLERARRGTYQPLPCLSTLIPLCFVPVVRGDPVDPVGEIKRPARLMGPETDERVFKRARGAASVRARVGVRWVHEG